MGKRPSYWNHLSRNAKPIATASVLSWSARSRAWRASCQCGNVLNPVQQTADLMPVLGSNGFAHRPGGLFDLLRPFNSHDGTVNRRMHPCDGQHQLRDAHMILLRDGSQL